tara:strand:- start:1070 stop:1342 length:273 start_codon:yes stop_codon:yes gene_type:complete
MKQVKIITPSRLTYQKTIHALDVEIERVLYTVYRMEDCKGSEIKFDNEPNVSDEVKDVVEALFWNEEFQVRECEELVVGEVFEVNLDDYQ